MTFLSYFLSRLILLLLLLVFLFPNASYVANITKLTYGTDISYGDPSWSPNGSKIIYSSDSVNNKSVRVI